MYKKINYRKLLKMYSDNPTVWYDLYQTLRYYDDESPRATNQDLKAIDDRTYFNELRFV